MKRKCVIVRSTTPENFVDKLTATHLSVCEVESTRRLCGRWFLGQLETATCLVVHNWNDDRHAADIVGQLLNEDKLIVDLKGQEPRVRDNLLQCIILVEKVSPEEWRRLRL